MKCRTKQYAIQIIRFYEKLPKNKITDVIGRQLIKSGTSVGANYRSACRARSRAEFISKLGIVEEETDETMYWIELLIEIGYAKENEVRELLNEANEILAIVISSIKTARKNIQ